MKHTFITAHSGCEQTARDSYESIEAGILAGADCVEVDVRMDSGALVLSHDRRERYGEAVRLERAFEKIVESGCRINCDLKEPSALYPVLELAARCGVSPRQLIFSGSVSCDLLAADPDVAKRAQIFLNIEELGKYFLAGRTADLGLLLRNPWSGMRDALSEMLDSGVEEIAAAAKSLGVEVLNLPYQRLTGEHIAQFRACGMQLSLWTVNSADDLRRLLREDLHNVTTLNAREALAIRAADAASQPRG